MPESHTPHEPRPVAEMGVTDIEPIDLAGLDLEEHGWRLTGTIGREYLDREDIHVEVFNRGDEVLEIRWVWDQDVSDPSLRLCSPLDINGTRWPVFTSEDVARALSEDRQLAQPVPAIYDTSPRRDTPTELYVYRRRAAEEIAEFRSEHHQPATDPGVEDTGRHSTLELDPDLPPWEVDHDGVVFDGPPQPPAIEPGGHDWPSWLSTAPLWDSPSSEEPFSADAMRVDRASEPTAAERFAALDIDRVEAARGLLRDYRDVVPYDEVTRRGLTLDDVSVVYLADSGELADGELADATGTDPWRPPAASSWQPAAAAPETQPDHPRRERERAAVTDRVALERGAGSTAARPGPAASNGGRVDYSAEVYTPDGDGDVRTPTGPEHDIRPASSDHQMADQLDTLQERLSDIRETLRISARERAPTSDASPMRATTPGRQVNPDASAGPDLSYGYPADTDPPDSQYQQSEIDPGPDIDY